MLIRVNPFLKINRTEKKLLTRQNRQTRRQIRVALTVGLKGISLKNASIKILVQRVLNAMNWVTLLLTLRKQTRTVLKKLM